MSSDPTTDDLATMLGAAPRRDLPFQLGRIVWIANLALLVGAVIWIFADPSFHSAAKWMAARLESMRGNIVVFSGDTPPPGWRFSVLWAVVVAAITTLLLLLASLFFGSSTHRRLQSWMVFMLLVAVWLTVLVGWREIAWLGQRMRLGSTVAQFDPIAQSLRDDWPTSDGEREDLGSFMAYPQGNPRMLMMLVSKTDPQISAIERADDGSLGFELRGEQPGTWLEWHPPGSEPATFVGGLEDDHNLNRVSPLGDGWYQVRYGQVANESPDNTSNSRR